jgi:NAD(P)-dependent dehydrogenase (short-subunit alcohol dehydrogenase family)
VTRAGRPLRGRVALVVGAGGPVARATALRLAAAGAAVVAAGPHLEDVLTTAGLVAAAGGVVRVVEELAPPLSGACLLEPPTDAVVSPEAFADRAWTEVEARALRARLPANATVLVLDATASPAAEAERVAMAFLRAPPAASGDPSAR